MLVLFSGPIDRDDSLAILFRRLGCVVTEVDTKIGGDEHDVTVPRVAERLRARVAAGDFHLVFAAPPCQSFSVAHRPKLRDASHPEGLPTVPDEWRRYIAKHNLICSFTFALLAEAETAGAMVMVENPAARGGPPVGTDQAYWKRYTAIMGPCTDLLLSRLLSLAPLSHNKHSRKNPSRSYDLPQPTIAA